MRKLSGIFLILILFAATSLFAKVTITINAPTGTGIGGLDAALNSYETTFRDELLATDLSELGNQDKLATGFGNAVAFASQSGSLAGYQGYDLFAILWGISGAFEAPSLTLDTASQISDDIKNDKDTDAGFGISSAFNLGLNITPLKNAVGLDGIFPNRMYMNVKYLSYSMDSGDFSFDATTFGLGLNYQLIDRGGDRWKFFKWSGLSVGTGFLHNSNKIKMKYEFEEYNSGTIMTIYHMGVTPDTTFGLKINSNVIPIDISTSARLLWIFNFTLGAGIDFVFGKSEIVASSISSVKVYDNVGTEYGTPGTATIDGGTNGGPSLAHARLTGGIGLCLGPIPLDFSGTWYPLDNGMAVNFSSGVVW